MVQGGVNPSLGDSIGRYRLIAELARGGMGIVYVAASQGPGGFSKLVALKELKPDLAEDADFLTMFLDEARMAARLNHPNIVQTNDVDVHDGRHFIAMEYLEGRSLDQVQKRFLPKGGLPQRVALTVLRDVLSALDYAHELSGADGKLLGFVHRDISPQNVFITFDGHTKVIDFGIAKARDSSLETKTGVLKGRVTYMAPEQLAHHSDRRSDLFSVGVILSEVVTGARLWRGLGEVEVLARLVRGDIPPLQQPGVPAALLAICQRALQPRPDDRYANAAEMRDALDEYLWTQGGPPKPREIAAVLLREYEPERRRRRELVEAALSRLQSGDRGRLATLAVPEARDAAADEPAHELAALPYDEARALELNPSLKSLPGQSQNLNLSSSQSQSLNLSPRRRWLTVGLSGLAVLVLVVLAITRPGSAPAPAVQPVTAVPPAPPIAAPVTAETILLSVSVAPPTAVLAIDDQPMPANPFVGRFPKAAGWHRLRASAPGYLPKERLVSFADNVMIDLTLPPRPAPTLPPPRRAEPHRAEPPSHVSQQRRAEPAPARPAPVEPSAPAVPALAPTRSSISGDIQPRSPNDPPRHRAIDATNPYGDDQ